MLETLKKDWVFAGFKRPKDVFKPEYKHALLLLVMLGYIGLFFLSEYVAKDSYHLVHCELDDRIPFNEFFIIPYMIWFPFWVLMLLYTMCFEVPTFKRMMKFFVITYTIAVLTFFIWPSGHDLRPTSFPRENICTDLVRFIYGADKARSIFPSEHVIGAFAVVFAAADSKRFSGRLSMLYHWFIAIMITLSVVYTKQHSVLDILGAAPVCLLGYMIAFYPESRRRRLEKRGDQAEESLKKA